jgi:hypothetical protein
VDNIRVEQSILDEIDHKSIYRAIPFCKKTSSKALLDSFVTSTNSLTELLSIKNAQMEAETEEEAVQLTDVVPFLVEDMLKEKGGIFSKGDN